MVGACHEQSLAEPTLMESSHLLGVTRFVLQNWTQGFSFLLLGFVFCFLETGSLTVAQVVFKLTKIQFLLPSASLVLDLQV